MFGAFRMTSPLSGGLLWKVPWRMSRHQKARQRKRLRAVDKVVAVVDIALMKQQERLAAKQTSTAQTSGAAKGQEAPLQLPSGTVKILERWKAEMPTEAEMLPRDKYTMFNKYEKNYRKGLHKLPKWTRVTHRTNPPGF